MKFQSSNPQAEGRVCADLFPKTSKLISKAENFTFDPNSKKSAKLTDKAWNEALAILKLASRIHGKTKSSEAKAEAEGLHTQAVTALYIVNCLVNDEGDRFESLQAFAECYKIA